MANITILNVDLGSVLLKSSEIGFADDTLTIAATTTLAEGTILARDSVSGKLVAFVKAGITNEDGIPKTVLTYDVANTTAGVLDFSIRAPSTASVRKQRLIIAADGNDSNVDAAVIDQLRDFGIFAIAVDDETILDNQ